jgi:predicted outer membrane repeat protein
MTRTLSRWLMSIALAVLALVAINLLVATSLAQGRPASLINCSGPIQACIDAANDGDTILIAAGRYTESLTLSKPVSFTGVSSDTTIIHAVEGQRVLTVTGAAISNSVVISGLTFTGGTADYGGGMLIADSAQPTLQAVQFISNAAGDGGGIFVGNWSQPGLLVVNQSVFRNNAAARGGGLYLIGTASLVDVQFEGNTAADLGGGINAHDGTLALTRTAFINNNGSALYSENNPATIVGGHFEQNSGGIGGAIWMYYVGANISHTTFISNTADLGGGGVTMIDGSIVNSRFEGNVAKEDWGGGLYAMGTTLVTNTVFVNNVAQANGGGAYFGNAEIYDSRFAGNTGNAGGGLFAFGLMLSNTDVISNYAGCGSWTSDCGGGGVYAFNEATVLNGRFARNVSSGNGGGLYANSAITIMGGTFISNTANWGIGGGLYAGSLVTLSDVDVSDNFARLGGGVFAGQNITVIGGEFTRNRCEESRPPECTGGALAIASAVGPAVDLMITGTRFISNSALDYNSMGGAIFFASNGTGRIVNALFSNNAAGHGTALFLNANQSTTILNSTISNLGQNPASAIVVFISATVNITDTIVTNHLYGIQGWEGWGNIVTEDHNLFFGNTTNTVGVTNGKHSLVGDPKFVDPSNGDYHLQFGSAAIDHGIDAGVYVDLDGNSRPVGAGFDIGAYEYQTIKVVYLPVIYKH